MSLSSVHARLGPYSKPATLARLDGRSREARFRKSLRHELVEHVGGKPSATQSALIEMAVDLSLQIELMKLARAADGALTSHDHRVFLAWSNTLNRTMRQLGLHGVSKPAPTLRDHLAQRQPAAAA